MRFSTLNKILVCTIVLVQFTSWAHAQCGVISSSPSMPVCANEAVTFTIETNHIITGWSVSDSFDFNSGNTTHYPDILSSTMSFPNGFSQNSFVKVHLLSCLEPDPVFAVNVSHPILENIISANSNTIDCETEFPVQITGTQTGESVSNSLYVWQKSDDDVSWQNIPLSNNPNYAITQYPTQSFYLRRVINTLACGNFTSNSLFFDVVNPPNGGMLNGGGAYCDSDDIDLELTDYNGSISTWEQSENGSDYYSIPGTAGVATLSPDLDAGTYYFRVLVENPGCESQYSTVATVTKYAPISNEIITPNQHVCGSQVPQNITANVASGGGVSALSILWQRKPASSDVWQNIPGTQTTPISILFSQPLTETTLYRRIASSDFCEFSISDSVGVFVHPVTVAGSFTAQQQLVCPGDEVLPIALQGHVGDIVDWFSAPDENGPWTSLNHTSSTFVPQDFTGSTYLRALVQSHNCEEIYTSSYHLYVVPEITDNNISEDQSICPGEVPGQITGTVPQGGDGQFTFLWQQSSNGTNWADAAGINDELNYTPQNLDENQFFRRLVTSGSCPTSSSNTVEISIHTLPTAEFSGGGMVCPDETAEITITLQGTPPFIVEYNNGDESYTTDPISSNEHTLPVPVDETSTYTLTAVHDNFCSSGNNFESSSVTFTPVPSPEPVNAGMDLFICGLSAALSGSSFDSNFHNSNWSDENGNILSHNADFTFTADQPGVHELTYSVEVMGCSTVVSSTITVTTDLPEVAHAGENQDICSTSTGLSATPVDIGSGHWIIPEGLNISNAFDPEATLSGMQHGSEYELIWVAESIEGICPNDSAAVTIKVDELSDAGLLSTSNESICAGESVLLQVSQNSGNVSQWIFIDQNGTQTILSSQTTVESESLMTDTEVVVVVQSGVCPADTSNFLLIEVNEHTQPGTLSEDQQVCVFNNSGTIEMSDFNGDILFWEISENNFETSDIIESNQVSYNFQNLENTTYFRTKVQSGTCPALFSNSVTVEVLESIDLSFDLADEYCSSSEAINLTALAENGESGEWSINGTTQSIFDPALYGNSEVSITYTNNHNGCGGSSTQTTTVFESPIIWTNADEMNCGLKAVAEAGSSVGTAQWDLDNGLTLDGNDTDGTINISATDFGTYNVTYTVQNGICSSAESIQITFIEEPTEANAGDIQTLEYTHSAQLNANTPSVGIGIWSAESPSLSFSDINDPKATVHNLKPGDNVLHWNISNGNCPVSTSKVIVHVLPFVVPNAFSPNGDNVNDLFEISGLEAVSPVDIKIWNRWGEEVFTSQNYQNNWDGSNKNGNELPSDTYYYLIKTPTMNEVLKGFIVLQR